jgi:hypothetical protein
MIEEEIYHQPEFWGEHPQVPQWEAVQEQLLLEKMGDTTEDFVLNVEPSMCKKCHKCKPYVPVEET